MIDASGSSVYRPSETAPEPNQHSDLAPLEASVLQAIKARTGTPEGVNVAVIAKSLTGKWSAGEIANAIDTLCEGGHIYSTIDEQHYDLAY